MLHPKFDRKDRVRETLRRQLTDIIQRNVKDPRLGFLTVTEVELSVDMRYLTVYISVLGNRKTQKETLKGLESAAPFIRHEIGQRVRLRFTPVVRFRFDETIERAEKLNKLMKRIAPPTP